eukprot:gene18818-25363_t
MVLLWVLFAALAFQLQHAAARIDTAIQNYPEFLIETNSVVSTYVPQFQPGAIGQRKDIKLECLNTTVGPPFNYVMKCPDSAKIEDWVDDTFVSFRGTLPILYIRIWEHYRKVASEPREFETNLALLVPDPKISLQVMLPGGVISDRVPDPAISLQVMLPGGVIVGSFYMTHDDTPEGVVIKTELIIGSGMLHMFADFVVNPTYDLQFNGYGDQITRHAVEEFGNFEFFLPELYATYHPLDPTGEKQDERQGIETP